MKKTVFLIVILLALSTLLSLRVGKVEAASTLRVPQDYSTIQAAINAALSGDTISVATGIYNENPTISLQSNILLLGQSSSNTVVNGNISLGNVNGVSIRNFDIEGKLSYSPICELCDVSNNIVRKGIYFCPSFSSIVNNIVYGNITMISNGYHAWAHNNTIDNNILYGGGVIIHSALFSDSSGNTIKNNTFNNAPIGVLEEGQVAAKYGSNIIVENNFVGCGIGVEVVAFASPPYDKSYSNITGNTFERCGYGVFLNHVFNVSVFHNNFLTNTIQAWVDQSNPNFWDNGYPSGGNYWSDYRGVDFYQGPNQNLAGSDSIGDTPYTLNVNNTDKYPLMSFSDEFSSTSVNKRWAWLNLPQNWFTSSGWLTVTPSLSTSFWSGYDTGNFPYQWMGGNFMVETKVSATLSTNYQQAGLMIRQDANNWVRTTFEYSDGLTVKTVVNRNNAANVEQVTTIPSGTTVVWLRVIRNGDSYMAYYSFDGSTWIQHYSWSQPLQGTLMVGLEVSDGNSMVAFQPSFDYFRYSNLVASSYSIQANELTFPCSVQSDSLVSSFNFNQSSKEIGFSVTGDSGTAGVCNVTFPTQLLGDTFTVLMDGSPRPATVTSDATHTSVFFTYSHSSHQVQIIGTSVVPEFPTVTANILVLAVLALMLLFTKRSYGARFRDGLV